MNDNLSKKVEWKITKFRDKQNWLENKFYEVLIFDGNLCLNCGINLLWKIFAGDKPESDNYFNNANSYLGVGNSDDGAVVTQTELQGEMTKFKVMDVGYPTKGTDQKIVFKSTFDTDDANFDWEEFGVANFDTNVSGQTGTLFNRKVESKGTKNEGEVWELQLTITLS